MTDPAGTAGAPAGLRGPRRPGERRVGRLRAWHVALGLLVVLCAGCAVLLLRITARPAFLDSAPAGAVDGSSIQAIAAALAGDLAVGLAEGSSPARVTVSDRDLTVIAAEENPDPGSFTDVQVRSGAGDLLLSARSRLGPLPVVVTARLTAQLAGMDPQIHLDEIDLGDQVLPGFLRTLVDPRGGALFDLHQVVRAMHFTSFEIGCVAVVPDGVELGFQPAGAPAAPGLCLAPRD